MGYEEACFLVGFIAYKGLMKELIEFHKLVMTMPLPKIQNPIKKKLNLQ